MPVGEAHPYGTHQAVLVQVHHDPCARGARRRQRTPAEGRMDVVRVHHPCSRTTHHIPHFARVDTSAQQPHGGLSTARRPAAALGGQGGIPRRRLPRQQLGGLAHPLAHQPHQFVHHALLTPRRAVAVVQEEDHVRDANTLTATIRIQNNRILTLTDPTTSIVIPTRARPDYLRVALASIAPQAAAAGAELLVVEDDRPSPEDRRARRALRRRATSPTRDRSG